MRLALEKSAPATEAVPCASQTQDAPSEPSERKRLRDEADDKVDLRELYQCALDSTMTYTEIRSQAKKAGLPLTGCRSKSDLTAAIGRAVTAL